MQYVPSTTLDAIPHDSLISLAQAGGAQSEEAKTALLRTYTPLILNQCAFAPYFLREDAESVAIEAFLRAVRRFDPTRSSSFGAYAKAWVHGAVKRFLMSVMTYEMRTISIDYSIFGDDSAKTPVPENLIETPTHDAELRLIIQEWMASMPKKWRYLLYLRFWNGMSQAEIARHLGISGAAVSKQFSRIFARARLDLHDKVG